MLEKEDIADLVIKNGTIINAEEVFQANISITDGKIIGLWDCVYSPPAKTYLDAKGKYLFPGLIDVHVHFYYDDLNTVSQAAAHGGLTTIIPFIRGGAEESILHNINKFIEEGERVSVIDFAYHVYLFDNPRVLKEIPKALEMGITSFKMFLGYKKRGMMVSTQFMLKAMEIIQSWGAMAMVHAEDGELIDALEDKFISEGLIKPQDYLRTCPPTAEDLAIIRAIELAHICRCPLYVAHLTTAKGLGRIKNAQEKGKNVITETCPQYLLLTEDTMDYHGPYAKISPPLRRVEDNEAMWKGLKEGTISLVSSDHAAYDRTSKALGWADIFQAPVGMIGVETIAPLIFYEGVVKRDFPLTWFARVMSANPARIFGLYPQKGVIAVGSDADITIIDPEKEVTIATSGLHSKADYSLYDGWRLRGYPVMSILRGNILLDQGRVEQNNGYGKFVPRPVTAWAQHGKNAFVGNRN